MQNTGSKALKTARALGGVCCARAWKSHRKAATKEKPKPSCLATRLAGIFHSQLPKASRLHVTEGDAEAWGRPAGRARSRSSDRAASGAAAGEGRRSGEAAAGQSRCPGPRAGPCWLHSAGGAGGGSRRPR